MSGEATVCSKCAGSGWESVEGRGVRPCPCKLDEERSRRLAAANIPARYAGCAFDSFDPYVPSLERALVAARTLARDFPNVDTGILFLGGCGSGKTHLAVAILKEMIMAKGASGIFFHFHELLKAVQESYNPTTHGSELRVLQPAFDADVLLLDELGFSKPTEWVQETITYIINRRYNDMKLTLFTSNYFDVKPGETDEESLVERVGVRLRSRLHEMCRFVVCEAPRDYRDILEEQRGGRFTARPRPRG